MTTWGRYLKLWPVAAIAAAAAVASAQTVSGQSVPSTGYAYDNNGNLHTTRITPWDPSCAAFVNTKDMCGSCTNRCPTPANGNAICALSCSAAGCGGTCDVTCNGGFDKCYGRCVDYKSDPNNCGGCGKVCAAPFFGSAVCSNGVCNYGCQAGTRFTGATGSCTVCGTRCVFLDSDPKNCGACGKVCATISNGYQKCVAGQCKYDCMDGFTYTGP